MRPYPFSDGTDTYEITCDAEHTMIVRVWDGKRWEELEIPEETDNETCRV